jgi:hypothetical protein
VFFVADDSNGNLVDITFETRIYEATPVDDGGW